MDWFSLAHAIYLIALMELIYLFCTLESKKLIEKLLFLTENSNQCFWASWWVQILGYLTHYSKYKLQLSTENIIQGHKQVCFSKAETKDKHQRPVNNLFMSPVESETEPDADISSTMICASSWHA